MGLRLDDAEIDGAARNFTLLVVRFAVLSIFVTLPELALIRGDTSTLMGEGD